MMIMSTIIDCLISKYCTTSARWSVGYSIFNVGFIFYVKQVYSRLLYDLIFIRVHYSKLVSTTCNTYNSSRCRSPPGIPVVMVTVVFSFVFSFLTSPSVLSLSTESNSFYLLLLFVILLPLCVDLSKAVLTSLGLPRPLFQSSSWTSDLFTSFSPPIPST